MKTPLSLLSLLALTAVSCQSAAGPEFEAGLTRVSFGGGLSQSATADSTTSPSTDTESVSSLGLDLTAGLFMSEDIEVGGNFSYASTETTDETTAPSTTTTVSGFGLGLYGRYYFANAEGSHPWVHAGFGMGSSGDGTTSESGLDIDFGIGHTHFLTDSAAMEIGAFYGMNSIGNNDTSGIDVIASYSIFW